MPLSPNSILCRFLSLAILSIGVAQAVPKPSPLFSDYAVLPSGSNIPIWGKATPGEKVTVIYDGISCESVADPAGRWMAVIPSVRPGASGPLIFKGSDSEVSSQDVIAGDVWLCTGQSNMELLLPSSSNAAEVIQSATNPKIRQFYVVPELGATSKKNRFKGKWQVSSPENAIHFSAIGYHFAQAIYESEKIPIGTLRRFEWA